MRDPHVRRFIALWWHVRTCSYSSSDSSSSSSSVFCFVLFNFSLFLLPFPSLSLFTWFPHSLSLSDVLNDETQRKYIQGVKRLMTYAQKKFAVDPSRTVG